MKTVTVFEVKEFMDMEGRRMKTIGYFLSEEDARSAAQGKGPGGMGSVSSEEIIAEGILKGVPLREYQSLSRRPIDKLIREAEMYQSVRNKLTPDEWSFVNKR